MKHQTPCGGLGSVKVTYKESRDFTELQSREFIICYEDFKKHLCISLPSDRKLINIMLISAGPCSPMLHGCGAKMQVPVEDLLGSEAAAWISEVGSQTGDIPVSF